MLVFQSSTTFIGLRNIETLVDNKAELIAVEVLGGKSDDDGIHPSLIITFK